MREVPWTSIGVGLFALLTALLLLSLHSARGQEHHHPPRDAAIHEQFYRNWMMPDNPTRSCCNLQDCYPAEVTTLGGQLYARRREDGLLIAVPPQKIERNRDSPDGRNHVCAPPPKHPAGDIVFCFVFGSGT